MVVYALQGANDKRQLWDQISRIITSFLGECIIMGDFNEVQDESERLGHLDLVDIDLGGPRFTWSDKWGSKFSKLDRFLVTEGIMGYFPHLTGLVLEKKIPDYPPILLLEHRVDYGPTSFRLFHSWFLMDRFDEVVWESWLNPDLGTVWNSTNRDQLSNKKKNVQEILEFIDRRLMIDDGSPDLREQRVSLLKEMSDLDHSS
uniref:Endonuclease/exonuclease/phosphatase domain-containing protein n=1 Tax=Lactuca sativa TaxID=4236 RepID=A0A9R1VN57_LACSA|nr:hypothetical protein LSAT_V11C500277190 [Lactuca sativa]